MERLRRYTRNMRLGHLGLPVSDQRRSLQFYATHFGFIPSTARSYPDGTIIVRNSDEFDLALHPTPNVTPPAGFLHFGFAMDDAASVNVLRERLERNGVPIFEHDDEPDLVSFKCLDPDGWRIEVYWEPRG